MHYGQEAINPEIPSEVMCLVVQFPLSLRMPSEKALKESDKADVKSLIVVSCMTILVVQGMTENLFQ